VIDIIVTTRNRSDKLKRMLDSLLENTILPFRLFIVDDHSEDGTADWLCSMQCAPNPLHAVLLNRQRKGVAYGVNLLWRMTEYYDWFYGEAKYLCYLQDDVEIKSLGWLGVLIEAYEELRDKYSIGFFTGYDAPEHPVRVRLPWRNNEVLFKESTAGQNLIASKAFWRSIGYIPRLNPDGTERGFPNEGRGSQFDVWLTGCISGSRYAENASAPNSSFNQGRHVLVVPGLVTHEAAPELSTWRT
jgi:glycosyltransferase involved in cell wall biosynthesis